VKAYDDLWALNAVWQSNSSTSSVPSIMVSLTRQVGVGAAVLESKRFVSLTLVVGLRP
jgi:hypothetical protein